MTDTTITPDEVDLGPVIDGRTKRRDDNRSLALTTARDMITSGVWRPSIIDIARTSRLSVRSLFSYFGSIEALIEEVAAQHGSSIYAALAEAAASPTNDMDEHKARLIRIVLLGRPT